MAEYVPRRMRRFLRREEEPARANAPATGKNPKDDRISEDLAQQMGAQQAVMPASELRYWDQKDPSLDELSTSLFEQLDAQPGASSKQAQPAKSDSRGQDQNSNAQAQNQKPVQAVSSEPKKESVLEARRRRREEKTVEKPSSPAPVSNLTETKPLSPPASPPVSQPPVSGLDVADLFAEDPQKKAAREKLEGELKSLQQELDADLAAPTSDSDVPDLSKLDSDLSEKNQKKKRV